MTPIVLVPGLLCSAEVFGPQIAALWRYGPVTVASTLEGETMREIAVNRALIEWLLSYPTCLQPLLAADDVPGTLDE
jgi:hypothetical protein